MQKSKTIVYGLNREHSMIAADVIRVLAAGEGPQCEFKRQIDQLESLAGAIVAFANSEGGMLLIGVEDDGQVVAIPGGCVSWRGFSRAL